MSLHTSIGEVGDSEFGDLIEDSEAVVPAEVVSFTLLQEQLHAVLATLSEREAGIVSMRYGLTDGQASCRVFFAVHTAGARRGSWRASSRKGLPFDGQQLARVAVDIPRPVPGAHAPDRRLGQRCEWVPRPGHVAVRRCRPACGDAPAPRGE